MSQLPSPLKSYFWDVNLEDLNLKRHSRFIIERILEYGDQEAVKWMQENYEPQKIKKVLKNSQKLSKKSANYWALVYDLDEDKVLRSKTPSPKKPGIIWEQRNK